MDQRKSRPTALDFAQAIGVLSRQHLALDKIAKRLAAGGFSEAARSVSGVADELIRLAAVVKIEADAAREARAAEQKRVRTYEAVARPADVDSFFARAYSVGPCPDCKSPAGVPCRVFQPPRGGPKSRGSNLGAPTNWPHRGRLAIAREAGVFDGLKRST